MEDIGKRKKMIERPHCGAIITVTYGPSTNGLVKSVIDKKR